MPSPVVPLRVADKGAQLWRGGSVHWEKGLRCTQDWLGHKFLPLTHPPQYLTLQWRNPHFSLLPDHPGAP